MEATSHSKSGSPVFTYTDGEKEWTSPHGEECIEEISNHIETHIGEIDMVFHEVISDTVHIDIHHVKPTAERPFHTLITSGMSDLKMDIPDHIDSPEYLELMVTLPYDWEITDESFLNEKWYWPVRQLKYLARMPHKYSTWFGFGHTIPNGDPAEAYDKSTGLSGLIILPAATVPSEFRSLTINDEKTIHFMSLVPLYGEEMQLKLDKGSDALIEKFIEHKLNDIIIPNRKNLAKKRFWFF
jgi:hypothetical protein